MIRGQAVFVPVALIAGWVALRLLMADDGPSGAIVRPAPQAQAPATEPAPKARSPVVWENAWAQAEMVRLPKNYRRKALQPFALPAPKAVTQRRSGRTITRFGSILADRSMNKPVLAELLPPSAGGSNAMPTSGAFLLRDPAQPSATDAPPSKGGQGQKAKRFSAYSCAFWRDGGGGNALAPQAQYGGSQMGMVAAYRLADAPSAPELSARFNIDAEKFEQPEAALGLRWRPLRKVPVALTIERRFREGPNDSVAAFLAGGLDAVRLTEKIELSGYAQAGLDRRDTGTKKLQHFYDANLKANRHIARDQALDISAGGGVWAGGQRGVNRVDAGPAVNVDFVLADTNWRLSTDYRFRLAGDASPGSGLAVTLSASY